MNFRVKCVFIKNATGNLNKLALYADLKKIDIFSNTESCNPQTC